MKRIDIVYDGIEYSLGDRDPDQLRAEINDAIRSGEPYWLTVNRGEGKPQKVTLLITAATMFALAEPGVDI
jgi:hypothetical protein